MAVAHAPSQSALVFANTVGITELFELDRKPTIVVDISGTATITRYELPLVFSNSSIAFATVFRSADILSSHEQPKRSEHGRTSKLGQHLVIPIKFSTPTLKATLFQGFPWTFTDDLRQNWKVISGRRTTLGLTQRRVRLTLQERIPGLAAAPDDTNGSQKDQSVVTTANADIETSQTLLHWPQQRLPHTQHIHLFVNTDWSSTHSAWSVTSPTPSTTPDGVSLLKNVRCTHDLPVFPL